MSQKIDGITPSLRNAKKKKKNPRRCKDERVLCSTKPSHPSALFFSGSLLWEPGGISGGKMHHSPPKTKRSVLFLC